MTLLTTISLDDPYHAGPVSNTLVPGKVLLHLKERSASSVFLYYYPGVERACQKTIQELKHLYPDLKVEKFFIDIHDFSSLDQVVRALREAWKMSKYHLDSVESFSIAFNRMPGLLQAAWIYLVSTREIPANILDVSIPNALITSPLVFSCSGCMAAPKDHCYVAASNEPFLDDELAALGLVGTHPSFKHCVEVIANLAPHAVPILLQGQTGTGKDRFARLVHRLSPRRNQSYIPVNAAALPEALAESILFGHQRGAFTGAETSEKGKFRHADGGTLFLDEVADLPLTVQAKLLRALEDGTIEPVGKAEPCKVNVRIIAATNKDLREEIKSGRFREDLYYRLQVGELHLPSLRERAEDIPKIAIACLNRINQALMHPKQFSTQALESLTKAAWPGNIRDLQNTVERAALLTSHTVLEPRDLFPETLNGKDIATTPLPHLYEGFSLEHYLSDLRIQIINKALDQSHGNQSQAARLLGISPQAVNKFVKKVQEDPQTTAS